jgi:hypothetical protein
MASGLHFIPAGGETMTERTRRYWGQDLATVAAVTLCALAILGLFVAAGCGAADGLSIEGSDSSILTAPPASGGPRNPPPDPPKDPPKDPPPAATCPAVVAASPACQDALRDPYGVSDRTILDCGFKGELGACVITGTCPTCACANYVRTCKICEAHGICGYPLNGTGCTSGYYDGVHNGVTWNCPGGALASGACMLRRLIEWGDCQ